MAAPAPRVIPGAPPPASVPKKSKKKSKPTSDAKSSGTSIVASTAKSTALLDSAPQPNELPESLKVQPQDLTEHAEKQAAIEAVKVIEVGNTQDSVTEAHGLDAGKSAVETAIAKKIRTLTKKIQRITGYESMDESKLNADQRRAISSKPALEMILQELNEVVKAVAIAQKEDKANEEQRTQQRISAAQQASNVSDRRECLADALEVVELTIGFPIFNLVNPNPAMEGASASFAPPSLPAALEQATGQEIAALAKVFDGFVNVPAGDIHSTTELLQKLEGASDEEVLEGVTYGRLLSIIQSLASPSEASVSDSAEPQAPAPSFVPSPSTPATPPGLSASTFQSSPSLASPLAPASSAFAPAKIRFMQASEILDELPEPVDTTSDSAPKIASEAAPIETDAPIEPEGGGVEDLPSSDPAEAQDATSTPAQLGAEGGKGSTMGGDVTSSALADATNVEEITPAPASQKQPPASQPVASKTASAPATRHFDWSADGDDTLDDLEFALPPLTSDGPGGFPSTSSMGIKAEPNMPPNGQRTPAIGNASSRGGANGGARRPPQQNGTNGHSNAPRQQYMPPKKPQPEVDEDGFTILPSRRVQQQQQQSQRGRGRGGGGAGGGQRGDGRPRGRGQGGGQGGQGQGKSGAGSAGAGGPRPQGNRNAGSNAKPGPQQSQTKTQAQA